MPSKIVVLGLDIGHKRIGVAVGDTVGRLAAPLTTLEVNGSELDALRRLLGEHEAGRLVVGLPRNQSGGETQQSQLVRAFVADHLQGLGLPVSLQDESLTSVLAEQQLLGRKKPYAKADVDALAATLILQDYLESVHG